MTLARLHQSVPVQRSSDRPSYRPTLEALEERHLLAVTITEFPLPQPNSFPGSLTAGPDGNVWFVLSGPKQIGRITPTGVITTFPVPGNPRGITLGPDGNLWFAEQDRPVIARIAPTGAVTELSKPWCARRSWASVTTWWCG